LGLRTFFFLLADLAERFHYLKYGLAFVLSFIGLKMLLPLIGQGLIMMQGETGGGAFVEFVRRFVNNEYDREAINISLAVVVGAIVVSILISVLLPRHGRTGADA
jgi:predicted tellurium resistance membrane protein TerC